MKRFCIFRLIRSLTELGQMNRDYESRTKCGGQWLDTKISGEGVVGCRADALRQTLLAPALLCVPYPCSAS